MERLRAGKELEEERGEKKYRCRWPLQAMRIAISCFFSLPHLHINLNPLALPDTFSLLLYFDSLFVSDGVWEQVRRFSIVL